MSKQIKILPFIEEKHAEYFANGKYMGCIHITSNETNNICASNFLFDRDMEYGKPKEATEKFLKAFLELNCMKSVGEFNDFCVKNFGNCENEKLFFFMDNTNAYKIQVFCNLEKFNINVHINKR